MYVYFTLRCHWPRHQSIEQLSAIHNFSQTAHVERDLDLSSPLSPVQSTQRLTRFGDIDRDMDRDKSMSLSPYLLPSKPARVSVSVHPHPPATPPLHSPAASGYTRAKPFKSSLQIIPRAPHAADTHLHQSITLSPPLSPQSFLLHLTPALSGFPFPFPRALSLPASLALMEAEMVLSAGGDPSTMQSLKAIAEHPLSPPCPRIHLYKPALSLTPVHDGRSRWLLPESWIWQPQGP